MPGGQVEMLDSNSSSHVYIHSSVFDLASLTSRVRPLPSTRHTKVLSKSHLRPPLMHRKSHTLLSQCTRLERHRSCARSLSLPLCVCLSLLLSPSLLSIHIYICVSISICLCVSFSYARLDCRFSTTFQHPKVYRRLPSACLGQMSSSCRTARSASLALPGQFPCVCRLALSVFV